MSHLADSGHRTILVGDSNGDRDNHGAPRYAQGRANVAAEALREAERAAHHTWMKPDNEGACHTRYAISKLKMDMCPEFDLADATSAVDHLSVGQHALQERRLRSYRLNDLHLGADHVGLFFSVSAGACAGTPVSKAPARPERKTLGADKAISEEYRRRSHEELSRWLEDARRSGNTAREKLAHMHECGRKLNEALLRAAEVIPTRRPRPAPPRQPKKRNDKLKEAMHAASARTGDRITRRTMWEELLESDSNRIKEAVHLEKEKWLQETSSIKADLEEGDWQSLWKHKRRKLGRPQDMTPFSFTDENGNHIWEKNDVMNHVRNEAHLIAEPGDDGYLAPTDPELEKYFSDEVSQQQKLADDAEAWTPDESHVEIMLVYFRRAYINRTTPGPDGVSADLLIHADPILKDCLLQLLRLIGETGKTPACWREMRIVLAHKEGRDPQNLRKSYRPICIGSLMMKAVERVVGAHRRPT